MMEDHSDRVLHKLVGLPSEYTDGDTASVKNCNFQLTAKQDDPRRKPVLAWNGELVFFTGDLTARLIVAGEPVPVSFTRRQLDDAVAEAVARVREEMAPPAEPEPEPAEPGPPAKPSVLDRIVGLVVNRGRKPATPQKPQNGR